MVSVSLTPFISVSADDYEICNCEDYKIQYQTEETDINLSNWTFLQGYDNCIIGTPDFDQKQDDWKNIVDERWCYDGPVSAMNALWWLDCKSHNGTNDSWFETWYGTENQHSPQNVIPLIDSLASNMSTEKAVAVFDRGGTNSSNFTRGLYRMFNNWSINDSINMVVEGDTDAGFADEVVNWSNITYHLDQGHAVVLLIGQYCWDGIGFSLRQGGHYVTCNGYNNATDKLYLSFADPYYDRNETGWAGYNTTHNHHLYENGSHNWTQNISYDFYEINTSCDEWAGNASEVINYTDWASNWSGMNWFGSKYQAETECDADNRTIIEMAWYIWEDYNFSVDQKVWNDSSSAWEEDLPLATPGTHQFNLTIENIGPSLSDLDYNITIFQTHYDCLSYYIPGSARMMYPNGTWYDFEPIRSWEDETCAYAGHGHLTWCIEADNITDFNRNTSAHIIYNMTYNCTNYSKTTAKVYVCDDGVWCQSCISDYINCFNATNCSLGRQFNPAITCPTNNSEESDWIISEHINRPCIDCGEGCLDEEWNEASTEYSAWAPYNSSWLYDDWKDWEWVYQYSSGYHGADSLGLSYTIANQSCSNRTQSTLRMKYNVTNWGEDVPEDSFDPSVGVIYSYTNDSEYHMVLYSYEAVFLLSKIGDNLYNTNDTSLVSDYLDAYNYFNESWACNYSYYMYPFSPYEMEGHNGIWSKIEWNPYCGRISAKAWNITETNPFALCNEPSGWIVDDYANYIEAELVTKGAAGTSDELDNSIYKILDVWQGGTHYDYVGNGIVGDYTWSGSYIDWSPLGSEPAMGSPYYVRYISWDNVSMFKNNSCFGLVTWNPGYTSGVEFFAMFDFIEVWKNNYSTPHDRQYYEDGSYYNHTMPKIDFKSFSFGDYTEQVQLWNTTCDWLYHNGTLSTQEYADCTSCFFKNITSFYNYETRFFQMNQSCGDAGKYDNQNDTVYYYGGLVTNVTEYTENNFNNGLLLQIMDTTDGHENWHDGAIVCIDVDNNSQWDDNDYCFVWWDAAPGTQYFIWNGTTLKETGMNSSTNLSMWFEAGMSNCPYNWVGTSDLNSASGALLPDNHRYGDHREYSMMIPDYTFIKSDGTFLNTSDEFGLSIMTVNAGEGGVPLGDNLVVWQDWNETMCKNQFLNENQTDAWSYILNLTNFTQIENFYIYGTEWGVGDALGESNVKYFGFGQIGNETGYLNQSYYSTNTTVTTNITHLTNISDDQLVRYDITICNIGEMNLTNIIVNFTLPAGTEVVSTNATSYWSPSSNYYVVNATDWLNITNCTTVWVLVNYTADSQPNGSVVDVWFNSKAYQPSSSSMDDCFFTYGENTAPVFNWTYPGNGTSPSLILNNISCYIYDNDGDNMDIYFYTNKSGYGNQTDTWTSGWYLIGVNKTVPNGHYWWNQTTNKTDRYCTKWRWGGTTYHFWLNLTDGKTWTNESFYFTTPSSRYDVTTSGDVVATDASKAWAYRTGEASYLGIYDVNGGGDITATDASLIWANRT